MTDDFVGLARSLGLKTEIKIPMEMWENAAMYCLAVSH
jgi:hypothetical protein